jgi:cyclase
MNEITLSVTALRDNVRVFTLGGESIATSYGANCTAVAGRESVLLVDPLIAPAFARRIEAAIAAWTPLPIRFVLVTHHHTDHALGAGYFAAKGVVVVAHETCRDRMAVEHAGLIEARRRQPPIAELFREAQAFGPSVVFPEDVTLDLGATQARVIHPGPGHTPGDAIVHLPAESVVICGDLVSAGFHVNYEDATVENLESGLDLLRSLDAQIYLPGHGSAGDSGLIDAQARYHSVVQFAVERDEPEAQLRESLRAEFPGFLLEEVLSAARGAWKRG